MDLSTLVNEEYKGGKKRNPLGSAHLDPRDAYRDVPILKKPVWNHQISAYFFLGGISAGSAAIGALAEIFGGGRLRKLSRTAHYVSFACFLPCPYFLIDDLGMPRRFHHMLRVFKPQSPMNLGAWVFLVHGGFVTLSMMRALAGEGGQLPIAGGLVRPIRPQPAHVARPRRIYGRAARHHEPAGLGREPSARRPLHGQLLQRGSRSSEPCECRQRKRRRE
jgi:hypothetical protein